MNLVEGKVVDVVSITNTDAYTLRLRFGDGHESVLDFGPFLRRSMNPQTRRFLAREKFRSYSLKDGNVVWGDYDMCFSIEQLYTGRLGIAKEPRKRCRLAVAESRAVYRSGGSADDLRCRGR